MSTAVENSGLPDFLIGWSVPDLPDVSNNVSDGSTLENENPPEVPEESEFGSSSPVEHSELNETGENDRESILLYKPVAPSKPVHSLSADSGFDEPTSEDNSLCDRLLGLDFDDNPAADDRHECGEEDLELPDTTESSQIVFQVTDSKIEHGGFSVTSSGREHNIKITDHDSFHVHKLKLMDDDMLIAINSNHVVHYPHVLLVETLRHMFDPDVGTVVLILKRTYVEEGNDGYEKFFEVKVTFSFPRRGNASMDMESILANVTNYTLSVHKLKLKGKDTCWIGCGFLDTKKPYIYAKGDALKNGEMKSFDQTQFKFFIRTYKILQWEDIHHQKVVLICSLQSLTSRLYVCVNGTKKVSLIKMKDRLRSTERGNPTHFIMTSAHCANSYTYRLESVAYPGAFLSWFRDDIGMKQLSSRSSRNCDTTILFEIHTKTKSI